MHDVYQWVKFLHVLATVLFAGWVFFAPLYLSHALRHLQPSGSAGTKKLVLFATLAVIGGGGALLLATGMLMGRVLSPDYFMLHWVKTAGVMLVATTLLWLAVLLPCYRQRLSGNTSGRIVFACRAAALAAAVMTFLSLWMMVVKPV